MSAQQTALPRLEVIQAVDGVFHHFDLARELESRGFLKQIYSTFPWRRLRREGVPRSRVSTFPWVHTTQMLLGRMGTLPRALDREIAWQIFRTFDAWLAPRLPRCDAFIALSGSGLLSGRRAQQMGARYICDRGSSHIRYQDRIVGEEYRRWGIEETVCDPRIVAQEEAEYAQADAITVPSEFARRSFIEMGVPAARVHRIPYGVRLDRFRQSAQPPADRFEVLFAGSVSLRKGVPYLLQAFARLQHPHKRLRIVGNVYPGFRGVMASLPQDHVEFMGHLSQPQLVDVMSASHVMVLPSVEEGLALVQAQALACGCPLISSYHTGGEDLFSDGVEGFLVPIRSPEAILARLQQLADDPALRQRMSEAALARVQTIGGWHEYGNRFVQLLCQLTGRFAPDMTAVS